MAEARADHLTEADLEERRKKIKTLTIIALLLLLALLFLLFLYVRPLIKPRKPLQFLFSVYGFSKPLSVSTDRQSNIYVSDTGNSRFLVFDKKGDYQRRIGQRKNKFFGVFGSVVDEQAKKIYIADWRSRKVNVFNRNGKFLFKFPKNSLALLFGASGFTPYDLDIYKNKVYVTSNNGIYIFEKNGEFIERWGQKGSGIGSYDFPNGIAIDDKTGTVYVADVLNRRLVAVKDKNTVQWVIGKPDREGEIFSFFGLPRDVALDSEGRVYVTDTFHHQIVILNKKGKLVSLVGERGTGDAKFNFPEGIAITPDDVIYIADRENSRIQALRVGVLPKPDSFELSKFEASFVGPNSGANKEKGAKP